jgi:hypothetical protein
MQQVSQLYYIELHKCRYIPTADNKFKIQSEVSSAYTETKYVHSEKQIELRISTIKVMWMLYYIPPKQKMGSELLANNITAIKYTDNLKKGNTTMPSVGDFQA